MSRPCYQILAVDRAGVVWVYGSADSPDLALGLLAYARETVEPNRREVHWVTDGNEPERGDVEFDLQEGKL